MLLTILDVILLLTTCNLVCSTTGAYYAYLKKVNWWRFPTISTTAYAIGILIYLRINDVFVTLKSSIFLISSLFTACGSTLLISFGVYIMMHIFDKNHYMDVHKLSLMTTFIRVIRPWIPLLQKILPNICVTLIILFLGYSIHYFWYKDKLMDISVYQLEPDDMLSKIKCRVYKPMMEIDSFITNSPLKCSNK